ncbi:hypothetical protein [Sphingomonas sp. GC_Shp_2]|nr:hypothetical protein [Sphingomonas sp. GC_Shp_2]
MLPYATQALGGWRNEACLIPIAVPGVDLAALSIRGQIRQSGDNPFLTQDLPQTADPAASGIRILPTTFDVAGVPTGHAALQVTKAAMQALPYAGEVGDPWIGTYAIQISGSTRLTGAFLALASPIDSDGAPANRPVSVGGGGCGVATAGIVLTIGDSGVAVSVAGMDLIQVALSQASIAAAALVVTAQAAVAAAKTQADRAQAYANQLPDFVQGSPGASATEVGLFAAAKGMAFAGGINRIRTTGRQLRGDGGAASYVRWVAPMPALTAAQQDYSWFQAADGSQWVLEAGQQFMAAMFGALGGNGIDARPILNAALAAPMVQTLNLGPLSHYCSIPPSAVDAIIALPAGKWLVGITRSVSAIYVVPVAFGTRSRAVQVVQHTDDVNGGSRDYSVYCQRSGLGGSLGDRVAGVTIRAQNVDGCGTTVERVDVYDATGYAHYDSADYGGSGPQRKLRGIERRECRAFNSQVCFESTGDAEVLREDCYANVSITTWDGGALVPCEVIYHEYGPIYKVRSLRCVGFGQAGAGAHPITADAYDLRTVIYEDCDIEVTNAVPAIIAIGQMTHGTLYVVQDLQLLNCRFVSANAAGASFANTAAIIRGGTYIGGNSAANGLGNGAGIDVSIGAMLDLYAPSLTGNSDPAGQGASYGLNQQAGVVRWHGAGILTANGPAGLQFAYSGTVQFAATPIMTPTTAGSGSTLPSYRQRVRGEAAETSWASYNPAAGNQRYFVNIALMTSVASRDLTDVMLSLHGPDGDLTFAQAPLSWNWQSDALIQVQIASSVALPSGFAIRYMLTEWST